MWWTNRVSDGESFGHNDAIRLCLRVMTSDESVALNLCQDLLWVDFYAVVNLYFIVAILFVVFIPKSVTIVYSA
jgi:hypothetical protein